jgi:hypothetical protein
VAAVPIASQSRIKKNYQYPYVYSIGNRMINEFGAVGGMRIDRGN